MKIKIFYLLFLISVFFACKSEINKNYRTTSSETSSIDESESVEEVTSKTSNDEPKVDSKTKVFQRKLIKKGSVSFKTSDKAKTHNLIHNAVKKNNGYISSDNDESTYDRSETRISIKVPFKNFDKLLKDISKGVKDFESKNISVSDVTEEFLDVTARAKTKKELENRYLQLLKKAKTVKDVIIVEKELEQIRSDIERMEGRLRYLQDNVSYSTLNITYYKPIKVTRFKNKYSDKIKRAFSGGFEGVKVFILVLVYIWPLIIVLLLIYFILKRYRNKK